MDFKKFKLSFGVALSMLAIGIYWIITDSTVQIVVRSMGYSELVKGIILCIINGLPLLFMPIFAKLSDKSRSKLGRRTPFIIIGSIVCAGSLIGAVFFARGGQIYGYAAFMILSNIAVAMSRPAATSLMPDVIPPRYRSMANSVSNVMSGASSMLILISIIIFGDKYFWIYIIASTLILVSTVIFRLFINEPKLVVENEFSAENFDVLSDGPTGIKYLKTLDKSEFTNLMLLLCTIFMLNFGFSALSVTTQNYAVAVWGMTDSIAAILSITQGAGGIFALFAAPLLSHKIGNRWTMFIAIAVQVVGLFCAYFITSFTLWIFLLFAVIGFGWTSFCVVSLPAVFNFSDIRNNGMFSSMYLVIGSLPKAITVLTSSAMIYSLGYRSLFVYILVCIAIGGIFLIASIIQRPHEVTIKI